MSSFLCRLFDHRWKLERHQIQPLVTTLTDHCQRKGCGETRERRLTGDEAAFWFQHSQQFRAKKRKAGAS